MCVCRHVNVHESKMGRAYCACRRTMTNNYRSSHCHMALEPKYRLNFDGKMELLVLFIL